MTDLADPNNKFAFKDCSVQIYSIVHQKYERSYGQIKRSLILLILGHF